MKVPTFFFFMLSALLIIGCAKNSAPDTKKDPIFPNGRKIANANFKGIAWVTMLAPSDSLNAMYAGSVRFEPGARTNWHSHPSGQLLIVTDGKGYYQEKGQPKRTLNKGDAVKCPPNTPHWHGATPEGGFTHIAVSSSEKGPTQWLEPVSEKEYGD